MMPVPPGWDTDEAENLRIGYVMSWEMAQNGLAGVLRIRIAQNPRQAATGGVAVQLLLPKEQIRRLASELNALADKLLQPHSDTPQ